MKKFSIFNFQFSKKTSGFSLIELLVAMTIVIVISTVAMVSYAGSSKKARDSRRVADLEKIRIALEAARQVGTTYPAAASSLEPTYISKLPIDPKSGTYLYTPGGTNYSYTLDAQMEDLGSTNGSYGGGYNYRVTNP